MKQQKYDIIIAGAGPAGLMLASDLSKDFSVLVLEKGEAGKTTRSWYTFMDRIKANGLGEAVVAEPRNLLFSMGKDSQMKYDDKHSLIDENKALGIFKERAESNGAEITSNVEVIDFINKKEGIKLKTKKGVFEGGLLIDCMGAKSPIVLRRKLQKNFNVYSLYGARIKGKFEDPNTMAFIGMADKYYPKNENGTFMFGVYPKGTNKGDVFLFKYYNHIEEPEKLKPLFKKSVKELFPKYESTDELRGYIYNGELKKYAFENVLFAGDSGCLTPPAIGMGFNENLRKHKLISKRLKRKIDLNETDADSLSSILLDYRNSAGYSFLKILQKQFYYGTSRQGFMDGIKILNKLGPRLTRKWMRNEVDSTLIRKGIKSIIEVVGVRKLAQMMPSKQFIQLSEDTAKVIGSSALKEPRLLWNKFKEKL